MKGDKESEYRKEGGCGTDSSEQFRYHDLMRLQRHADYAEVEKEISSSSESEGEYLWTMASYRPSGEQPRTCTKLFSQPSARSSSAPPPTTRPLAGTISVLNGMLAGPVVDVNLDEDDWVTPSNPSKLYRAASVGNSWGVTSIGRGFDWNNVDDGKTSSSSVQQFQDLRLHPDAQVVLKDSPGLSPKNKFSRPNAPATLKTSITLPTAPLPIPQAVSSSSSSPKGSFISGALPRSPVQSAPSSPRLSSSPHLLTSQDATISSTRPALPRSPSSPRSPLTPRTRRRSSQQRVSLIAGRVSIVQVEPPSPPPIGPQKLVRANSAASFLSQASSTGPPTPNADYPTSPAERSISEFVIEKEIGRGAYGLVKRAREMKEDGTLGPPLVIKQIIKSRILADCWKRHPKFGTIPIEIYVMSSISSIQYVLPPRRPWDPSRMNPEANDGWVEGKVVNGHPNVCPLLDFFEDNHYYYLVLPSTTPEPKPDEPPPPSDLFDLVENYPHGLPPSAIRSYLGQMADAMCFLHSKGIVHRDIKDENVVLGPAGKCVLIDFGSSGLVKKGGWDTFSGTLDYAGPEILRGERYYGKEQDVWAFGVVAYVLLVGECPFTTAAEAQEGLESPFANAAIALDERCMEGKEKDGEEQDGGGALGDAATLVRACLRVEVGARPTFQTILQSRFLIGHGGWGLDS